MSKMLKNFKLSATLMGHSLDVRCIAVASDNTIISGSRDKTAKLWKPNGINSGYNELMTFRDQKNFVICVLYLDPSTEFPDGLVVAGGNDNAICVYKPFEPFTSLVLKEHSNAVSCLSKSIVPNSFLSGSWDCTGKLWNLKEPKSAVITFSGHTAAIWSIIQLQDSRILTASADKTIGMWSTDGGRLKSLSGHSDCVRGVADFPESQQFLSVSNDATVKVWNYSGENIDTYYGHTNYIYSIAKFKEGDGFVTSDEDRTVRCWHNGVNTQTFQLPAQSVWSVACLNNGDIVTGSSDGLIRIFTQDEARMADEWALTMFNEEVEAITKQSLQQIGGYKISDLPGKEGLYDPGKNAGQMKMIREGGGVCAYTWVDDGPNSHWEKVGDVLGGTDKDHQDKTLYEGKSYDFVFTVDVEDGKPPLKLPYNKGDDPYKTANEFLTKNMLPSSYLEQVVDFILKNSKEQLMPVNNDYVDPFTGGSRYTPSANNTGQDFRGVNLDPFTGGNSYSTVSNKPANQTSVNSVPFTGGSSYTSLHNQEMFYFPQTAYRSFEMGDVNVILGKLKEFNSKCVEINMNVDEKSLEEVVKICSGPPQDPNSFDLLFKLLDWRDDIVFPVLDVTRLAVRHKKNNDIISTMNNGIFMKKLLCYVNEHCKIANNTIVALRTLCNLFSHELGENLVFEGRFDILENITSLTVLNKSGQIALATLLLNMTIVTLKKGDDLGCSVLSDVIPDILIRFNDPESLFRAYVALGTLITSVPPQQVNEIKVKLKANSSFSGALQSHLMPGQGDLENKKKNCAKQVQDLIN